MPVQLAARARRRARGRSPGRRSTSRRSGRRRPTRRARAPAGSPARRARRAPRRTASPPPRRSSRARASTTSRIASPSGVPPGSRVETTSSPRPRSQSARSPACVVFPDPSGPSKLMNTERLRYGLCGRRSQEAPGSSARTSSTPSSPAATRCSCIDDLSFGKREYVNPAATLVERDIRDGVDLEGVEVVFHLAAQTDVQTSVREPGPRRRGERRRHRPGRRGGARGGRARRLHLHRRGDLRRVRRAGDGVDARASPAPRTGSPSSAARSTSPASTASTATSNVVARLGNVFGPRQSPSLEGGVVSIFLDRLARGEQTVIFGDGLQVRDFVYVGDVVDALLAAGGHDGRRLQRRQRRRDDGARAAPGLRRGRPGRAPSRPSSRPGSATSAARRSTSRWRPPSSASGARTSLADGIARTWAWTVVASREDSAGARRKSSGAWTHRFSRRTTWSGRGAGRPSSPAGSPRSSSSC